MRTTKKLASDAMKPHILATYLLGGVEESSFVPSPFASAASAWDRSYRGLRPCTGGTPSRKLCSGGGGVGAHWSGQGFQGLAARGGPPPQADHDVGEEDQHGEAHHEGADGRYEVHRTPARQVRVGE